MATRRQAARQLLGAAGTPVIAVDTPAIRQVAGAHARFVPPGDVATLTSALAEPHLSALSLHVREKALRATWKRSALAHLAAYERAMGR